MTGASGFVGRRIVHALARDGHHVVSFGRRSLPELTAPLSNYRSWDLRSALDVTPAVDAVVHCGALVGDWGAESEYHAVNVGGTQAVIDSFPNARIVHVSTSSVYSDSQPTTTISESAHTGNCRYSAYARTKAAAEQLLLQRGNSAVLRPHIVYGPGDSTLLPRLLAARRFNTLFLPGSGNNMLSVTHVDNLVDAVVAAVVARPDAQGAFNIADAEHATLRVLLQSFLSRLGQSTRLVFIPEVVTMAAASALEQLWPGDTPPRGPMLTRYVVLQLAMNHILDISRAREHLAYRPRWDFRTGSL